MILWLITTAISLYNDTYYLTLYSNYHNNILIVDVKNHLLSEVKVALEVVITIIF